MRGSIALVLVLLVASIARAERLRPAVLGVGLPSRRAGSEETSGRIRAISRRVAARLGLPAVSGDELEPTVDFSAQLRAARARAVVGALDEAAIMLDAALEEGVRQLHRLERPADLLVAHLLRVSIALARGEDERGRELFARLLHYDPGLKLEPAEDSPQMTAAFDRARRSIPEPPQSSELGDAARDYAVVIIGRVARTEASASGALTLELFRFDSGIMVARATSTGDRDDELAPLMERPADPVVMAAARAAREAARPRFSGRGYRVAGIAAGALGLALAGVGTYFAADAASKYDAITEGCESPMPCPGELVRQRADELDESRLAAGVLLVSAGAAMTAGVVLYVVGYRRDRQDDTERGPRLSIRGDGVDFAWAGTF